MTLQKCYIYKKIVNSIYRKKNRKCIRESRWREQVKAPTLFNELRNADCYFLHYFCERMRIPVTIT